MHGTCTQTEEGDAADRRREGGSIACNGRRTRVRDAANATWADRACRGVPRWQKVACAWVRLELGWVNARRIWCG